MSDTASTAGEDLALVALLVVFFFMLAACVWWIWEAWMLIECQHLHNVPDCKIIAVPVQ